MMSDSEKIIKKCPVEEAIKLINKTLKVILIFICPVSLGV